MATGRKGSKPATSSSRPRENQAAASTSSAAPDDIDTARSNGAPSGGDIVATVRGLAEVVAEHTLSELIVDLPDATITLRRGAPAQIAPAMLPPALMPPASAPALLPAHFASPAVSSPSPAPAAPAAAPAAIDDKSHVVTSPFVGTFYRRPNPYASTYVEQGQKVEKGQVLCIIEAMKLMNEIEADVAGVISGIMAEDGAAVEYGQPLFRIAPA